jgi:hypothetical protein
MRETPLFAEDHCLSKHSAKASAKAIDMRRQHYRQNTIGQIFRAPA